MIGVSNSTLARHESEYRAITLENLKMIANACGFEILFRNKEKNKIYKFDDINIDYDIRVTTK